MSYLMYHNMLQATVNISPNAPRIFPLGCKQFSPTPSHNIIVILTMHNKRPSV